MKYHLACRHGSLPMRVWVMWLFFFVIVAMPVIALAQSTCSTSQSISAPESITPESFQNLGTIDSTTNFCANGNLDASAFQKGLWFRYTPSKARIVGVSLIPVDDSTSLIYVPGLLVLKGSCDALTCVDDFFFERTFFQVEPGEEYFIYIYEEFNEPDPFTVIIEEIEPPSNDKIDDAVNLTHEDLPFKGEFTTDGALSDFTDDACGLNGEYGIWFSYTTPFASETLVLQVEAGGFFYDAVGIQYRDGDGFSCLGTGREAIQIVLEGDVQLYFLVVADTPDKRGTFEVTLQSQTYLPEPTSAESGGGNPVQQPAPVSAPAVVSPSPTPAIMQNSSQILVLEQTTCSASESISAPATILSSESIPTLGTIDSTTYLCASSNLTSSAFQTGLWFRYTPSRARITGVSLIPVDDSSTLIYLPGLLILKGSCDALTCVDDFFFEQTFFQVEPGEEYFIYIYEEFNEPDPFTVIIEEMEPPSNDNIDDAIVLTHEDLPFKGEFTTDGALSDFTDDACGLYGEYGIWFSYTTPFASETLVLQVEAGGFFYDAVGIQYRVADGFSCLGTGQSNIRFTAEGNVEYYFLVVADTPDKRGTFEVTLQSRSQVPAPTRPDSPSMAPKTASPASGNRTSAPQLAPKPVSAPTGVSPSSAPVNRQRSLHIPAKNVDMDSDTTLPAPTSSGATVPESYSNGRNNFINWVKLGLAFAPLFFI